VKIYPVEKNVPRSRKSGAVYPFAKMEVNDSFKFDGNEKDARTIRSAASMHAARTGTKFSIKKDNGGYRCWRIS
jgi:hypothetical protein